MRELPEAKALFSSFEIPKDARILVGLSGGCDSVALLTFLLEEVGRERLAALHVNHLIRGEEAERDEEFSRALAEKTGVRFAAVRRDIPREAKKSGRSLEEAAREARYALFEEYAGRFSCRYVALGHHRDDLCETFFFHLIRGAGKRGLSSIPPQRKLGEATVIRPLLHQGKEELRAFLLERGENWVEDSTNADPAYTRNRLRAIVLPELEKINPRLSERTAELAEEFREEEEFLSSLARGEAEKLRVADGLSSDGLRSLPRPLRARAIRDLLEEAGAPWSREILRRAEALLEKEENAPGAFSLGRGRRLENRLGVLRVQRDRRESFLPLEISLEKEGEYPLCHGLSAKVLFGTFPGKEKADKNTLYLRTREKTCLLRPRRTGDAFVGTYGKKSLKKLMIDRKIPRETREKIPVAEIGGEIAGLMGEGASLPFRVKAPGEDAIQIVFIHETEEK